MKIAVIYFSNEEIPLHRKHHSVNDQMLLHWVHFFILSKTNLTPVLITDSKTVVPSCWPFEVVVVKDSEPPKKLDVLHKVGWLKMQAFDLLGHCLIIDVDAIIYKNIDELVNVTCPIVMSPYASAVSSRTEWPYWKYNAGMMIVNSSEISKRFKILWNEKQEFLHVTYFDELIFTQICQEMGGVTLDPRYQADWIAGDDSSLELAYNNPRNKVLHFCGVHRKKQLNNFCLRHKIIL